MAKKLCFVLGIPIGVSVLVACGYKWLIATEIEEMLDDAYDDDDVEVNQLSLHEHRLTRGTNSLIMLISVLAVLAVLTLWLCISIRAEETVTAVYAQQEEAMKLKDRKSKIERKEKESVQDEHERTLRDVSKKLTLTQQEHEVQIQLLEERNTKLIIIERDALHRHNQELDNARQIAQQNSDVKALEISKAITDHQKAIHEIEELTSQLSICKSNLESEKKQHEDLTQEIDTIEQQHRAQLETFRKEKQSLQRKYDNLEKQAESNPTHRLWQRFRGVQVETTSPDENTHLSMNSQTGANQDTSGGSELKDNNMQT